MYYSEEEIIIDRFNIPKIEGFEPDNLKLKTNVEEIQGTNERNFFCKNGNYKFCLVKKKDGLIEPIFIMDFFHSSKSMQGLRKEESSIKLELLWVKESYRKKGIATYYMKKLVKYAIAEGFTQIRVIPNPNANNFKEDNKKNALNKEQLTYFYKKFESECLKITFI
ncbi:GNAT family N-acetyltransferase [Niallia sp. BSM11]|uniref:GNAT family N-acetyltransferase n=1 Tax=Niallia sp. BSM11 TaxID=3391576 RepID=UPI003985590A